MYTYTFIFPYILDSLGWSGIFHFVTDNGIFEDSKTRYASNAVKENPPTHAGSGWEGIYAQYEIYYLFKILFTRN